MQVFAPPRPNFPTPPPGSSSRFPPSSAWLVLCVVFTFACQLGLLFELLAPFRVVFRSAAYGFNIAALFLAFGRRKHPHHPAFWPMLLVVMWQMVQLLHPNSNTTLASIASLGLMIAVVAPLFWVPRLDINFRSVQVVFGIFFCFHFVSSCLGVLQVYFPGQYQPAVSQAVKNSAMGGENLKVTLAGGDIIYRPMGLSDTPGGAAMSGLFVYVFGLGYVIFSKNFLVRAVGFGGLLIGLFCIYLTQVRVALILAIIISITMAVLLVVTQRITSAVTLVTVVLAVQFLGFTWAVALGGAETLRRFETLIEDDPDKLYYKNRGFVMEELLERDLGEYPFGAGLGRWGMVHAYFGDPNLPDSPSLWGEIQWQGWLFDGGFLTLFGYPFGIALAILATFRVAFRSRNPLIASWAILVLAYNVSICAFTFSYSPFVGQVGMEFWLINSMIWAADRQQQQQQKVLRRA